MIVYALAFLMLFAPSIALAQNLGNYGGNYVNQINVTQTDNVDLGDIAVNIINWVLGFLALIAIIIVLLGGFQWMTSGGNPEKVGSAKKTLIAGLVGLAIIFLSWAIVMFVFTRFEIWGGVTT